MKRFPVFLLSSFLFASVAGAAITPGPETPAAAAITDVAAFDQADGRIASDGSSFLAVWTDDDLQGSGDIHASRVTSEGERVDDTPILVAATSESESRPSIAWGTDRYLVVWSTPGKLQARVVAPDGSLGPVLDLETVANTTPSLVAFNGHVFLVLWEAEGLLVRGAILEPDGTLAKTFDVVSSAGTNLGTDLVAADGTFYYVTSKIDTSGTPTRNGFPGDVGLLPIAENGTTGARIVAAPALSEVLSLRAAVRGNEILVAWETLPGLLSTEVRNVRVTAGVPGAMDAFTASRQWLQEIVAEPSGFVLLYGDERQHFGTRSSDGANPFAIPSPALLSRVVDAASNGTRTLLVTSGDPRAGFEHGPAGGDLYLQELGTDLAQPLAFTPRHQQNPDIAIAEETGVRLAVWCEYVGAERRLSVFAERIAPGGTKLDALPIDLGANVYHPVSPRVATDGENWLVVWRDLLAIYGMRVAAGGTPLDAQPFVIADDVFETGDLALAWDEPRYVVVFLRGQFLRGLKTEVKAALVTANGVVQTPELTLSTVAANETPAIASASGRSLVVWYSAPQLQGALFSGGAIVPVAFPHIAAANRRPAVAANDDSFLVATPATGPFGTRVEWAHVDASGNVSVPQAEFLPIDAVASPVAYGYPMLELEADASNFLLYFHGVAHDQAVRTTTIYAARISERGQLLDEPVAVANTLADYAQTFGASGRTVAYARRIGHTTREVMRTFYREMAVEAKAAKRRAVR